MKINTETNPFQAGHCPFLQYKTSQQTFQMKNTCANFSRNIFTNISRNTCAKRDVLKRFQLHFLLTDLDKFDRS